MHPDDRRRRQRRRKCDRQGRNVTISRAATLVACDPSRRREQSKSDQDRDDARGEERQVRTHAEGDDGIRGRRLLIGEASEQTGVVADSGKPDCRPAHSGKRDRETSGEDCSARPASE